MKTITIIIAVLLMQLTARAQITVEKVLGTAWTIGNAVVGQTTLTPAYSVNSYYLRQVSKSGTGDDRDTTKTFKRDLLGNVFYHTHDVWTATGIQSDNNAPFAINDLNRLNETCITPWGDGVHSTTNITVESHTTKVWLDSAVRTGLWPDNGPWTVYLKTGGSKTSCSGPTPTLNYYYWKPASVALGGAPTTVSLGTPNCVLNYPFYLANDFYR